MTRKVLLQQNRLARGNCVAGGNPQEVGAGSQAGGIPQKLMNAGWLNGNGKIINLPAGGIENFNVS